MAVIVREKKKGSGVWWIFINHQGKRRSKRIGDKRTANNVAKEIRARLAKGEMGIVKEKPPTLSAYGREMLDSSLNGWSDATVDLYKATYRLHIKPPLGHRRLDGIKKRHVKTLITNLKAKGLAASTVETALKVLRIILNHAVEDEYIAANPCDKMNKYCGGKTKKVNQLDAEETQQFVEGASHLPLVFNALFVVKVRTGLRIGEIMAIEWSDVDLNERTININKQWDYKRKEIRPPKNGSSRIVRLTPMTVEILKQLQKEGNGSGLVFPDEHGDYLTYKAVRLALLRIAPKPISLHGLRQTYAPLRLARGDNIVDVSKQLGHKNITVTLDTYTHWIPMEEYQQQVDELDTLHLSAPLLHPGESTNTILQ